MGNLNALIAQGGGPAVEIENPMNGLAKMLQIKQAQQQNAMGEMQMQQARQGQERTNRLNALLGGFKPDATADDQVGELTRGGFLPEARSLAESASKVAKEKRDAEKAQLEGAAQKLALSAQILGGATDQASYDNARATAQANGLDVSRMPPQFDPMMIAQKLKEGQSVKDQLEQIWKQKGYDLDVQRVGETQRHNKSTEQLTANGQKIQVNEGALNRGNSMSIARMADERSRDANSIKLGEKKATEDLTKGGQLASFDTMIGTLDRLSQHPGLTKTVGLRSVLPTIPGGDSANFQAELNTFQSQAFIPMVSQLKGMGALSDAEGKKLTQAVGALDPKMGEKAFRDSIDRIKKDMDSAYARVAGKPRAESAPKPSPNPQDAQALEWANANPNDPRAAQIKQRLGQ